MNRRTVLILLLGFIISGAAFTQELAPVDAQNPVYDLLDRAYAHGWISYLPQVRPLPLGEIRKALSDARSSLASSSVRGRDRFLAEIDAAEKRLMVPFSGHIGTSWGEGAAGGTGYLYFPLESTSSTVLENPADTEWIGTLGITGGVSWGSSLFLGMDYDFRAAYRPNTADPLTGKVARPYPRGMLPDIPDYNIYTFYPGSGEGGFNLNQSHRPGTPDVNLLSDAGAQAVIDFGFGNIGFSRQKASWGPGAEANLVLSQTAKPYDALTLSLDLGTSGRFVWNTGYLQQEKTEGAGLMNAVEKMVTMHRVEFQITPWFLFSIFESIIYEPRFELSYINPFSLYYVTEVRNGDTDNKLGGIDLVFRGRGVKAFLSLFADDWDASAILDFGYYHNIFAVQTGFTAWDVFPGLRLQGEYAYLSHWMYAHRSDYGNRYLHFGESLGYPMEPNSHRFMLDAEYTLRPETAVGLRLTLTQRGRGNYFEDGNMLGWDIEDMYAEEWNGENGSYRYLDIGMPGAFLETTLQTRVSGKTALPWQGFSVEGGYTFQYQNNAERIEGETRLTHFFDLAVALGF